MQIEKQNTPTETQTELDLDLFDITDNLDIVQPDFENVRTLLDEISYDLQQEIKHDGSKEDEQRKANLINRRPILERFLNMAIDYVIKLQDTVKETVDDLHAFIKQ